MDGASSIIKYILFVCNFLFAVVGLLLVVFGSISAFSNGNATKILEDHHFIIVGVLLIFIGLCIFSVTFFGCWGALYEKYSMLYTYGILLTVLLLLQLIFYGIILYFYKKDCNEQFIKEAVEKFFDKYYAHKTNREIKQIIDHIQETYSCCGVEGPDYWNAYGKQSFPPSCCPNNYGKCYASDVYHKGCLNDIKENLASKFHSSYIIYSLVIQILVIGSTFYLAKELTMHRADYDTI